MGRRKAHAPLNVLVNNRLAGRLLKEASGAIAFQYAETWLAWEHGFPISLSLPMRETAYAGETVFAVFDNLLPDSPTVRRRVAERTGAQGSDSFSLLERIGRDCVGAMQFLPDGVEIDGLAPIAGEPISEAEIERLLENLTRAPLGIDIEHEFRISVAGVQEKTALLFHEGQWLRPVGTTPTTHILKPQLGEIPTAFGMIDMANSVENEHYCLKLMEAFGLPVARTEIATFGARKVLVVERFDRRWRNEAQLLRLPQEDCCQALGIPSAQKYQSHGGPSAVGILKLLGGGDNPLEDRAAFLKSQILFWLIGATDGHAKNFSIFIRPGGRYELTPFYDVLSAQPVFDARQIPHNKYKLAMSAGASRKYQILNITGRHFIETAKEAGIGPTVITKVVTEIIRDAAMAPDHALSSMPEGFETGIHDSVVTAIHARLRQLELALAEL
ncbi:type II toxin-antitoxin system HipA family toxin [Sphingomonas sp. LaA6.9]|uniref:type II toxin-antitoxin system HipA family toxin n=1 Tax=Sphingomonas sp. LaA6.9 TaxID=2919914 RepID=UPI001F4F661F|nr:type II toxin-antitoxin system HipA family toxin [Sphingomonas sp. LaA6.9]MCJ8158731.1 type II toxin-antitoxin system HipA family toxin [Sphingomonas sp. LaA6.9]